MSEVQQLSSLIGKIYDVALDQSLWPDAIKATAEFVGGSGSALFSKNTVSRESSFFYQHGHSQEAMDSYFSTYAKLDPTTIGQFMYGVGEVYSTGDLLPYDEFVQTRFFREWAKPQGWVDHIASTLEKTAMSFSMFAVVRTEQEGIVDDEVRRRMSLIVPHIRRAVLIGNVIDLHKFEHAALADSLDHIAAGVFLLDDAATIFFANAAGRKLLGDEGLFRDIKGTLTAVDSVVNRTLRDILSIMPGSDIELGAKGIALPALSPDGERWLMHLLPLTSGARKVAGASYSASVALFVQKASMDAPSQVEATAKLYKLTPSELRVLGAVLQEVGGIPALADTLGISEATVKTHLQHLFQKTGVRRQIDLVKLVAGLASSLVT